jgi:hypothetical protein
MRQLSLRQTVALWGGLRPARRVSKALGAMDVTSGVRAIDPRWPTMTRVAAVHIGVEKFFWDRARGSAQEIRREIIEARSLLKRQGYTHIAVTGPFLLKIRRRARLNEVHTFSNARAISTPICALYRARLSFWDWASRNGSPTRTERLRELRATAGQGFKEHGVFAI